MSNIESQFNIDITTIMDDAFGETFTAESGTEFTAQFTPFRSEPIEANAGLASEMVAELRWQETALAAPAPEYKFKRNADGLYWRMRDAAEVDGGEVIATVYQTKRSKTGAV